MNATTAPTTAASKATLPIVDDQSENLILRDITMREMDGYLPAY